MGCFPSKSKIITSPQQLKKVDTSKSKKSSSDTEKLSNVNVIHIENSKLLSISDQIKIKNLITKVESQVEDNYKILNKLGKGSFGSVFKVLHLQSGLIRAMKIIKKDDFTQINDFLVDQAFKYLMTSGFKDKIISELKKYSRPVNADTEIFQVASISANNDEEVEIISEGTVVPVNGPINVLLVDEPS